MKLILRSRPVAGVACQNQYTSIGASLIELLCLLAIFGVFSLISLPSLGQASASHVRTGARFVASVWGQAERLARESNRVAIVRHTQHDLVVLLEATKLQPEVLLARQALPKGVILTASHFGSVAGGIAGEAELYPSGSGSAGHVVIEAHGKNSSHATCRLTRSLHGAIRQLCTP